MSWTAWELRPRILAYGSTEALALLLLIQAWPSMPAATC